MKAIASITAKHVMRSKRRSKRKPPNIGILAGVGGTGTAGLHDTVGSRVAEVIRIALKPLF
jgi:hypothetical protein